MKNRKALSSVVGIVFSIIALVSVVTYITYGMNSLEKFNQQVLVENTETVNQGDETFDTVKAETVNNKFNITVQNTGNLPINITRLWIQNKTDPSWGTYKYDINVPVSPGEVQSNIGQNIDLYTLDTQGYEVKLTTERGNAVEFLINSPTQESLGMKLVPTPDTIPTDFTTTVIYQIVNNSTGKNMLLNLQPQLSASGTAAPALISGPTPSSYPSLARGDTATFVWVYKLTGDDGTSTTFNATLVNAKQGNWVTATATVKEPLSAVHAGTVIDTSALVTNPLIDSLLILHNETLFTPGGAYQMYSGDSDAGINGSRIKLNNTSPSPKFFTNNGSAVSIPAGTWVISLQLQSEALPTSLVGKGESMIFHFEDGDNANPYNSQGNATRNLRPGTSGGNSTILAEQTVNGTAQGAAITSVTTSTSITGVTDQLYLASVSVNPNIDVTSVTGLGLTWTQLDQQCGYKGTTRTEVWKALGGATTGTITATVAANAQGLAISVSRFSGINTVSPIGNVTSSNTDGFESNNCSGSTATSSYSTSIKTADNNAMVWGAVGKLNYTHTPGIQYSERADISSGSTESSAGVATENKTQTTAGITVVNGSFAKSIDWSSIAVEITPSTKCAPDWQAGSGPQGSGAYYFNGVNNCLRSIYNVSSVDGIYSEPDTTALWFKTDGQLPPSGEWDLVYWEGPCVSSKCYYYKIYLDNQANVRFEFNTKNSGGQEITTCESTKPYDNNLWYHVVAVRDIGDKCTLYMTYLNGTASESAITVDNSYAGDTVITDGKWYVGINKQENANWFKGWIDDVIHWNSRALTSAEADDLAKTNYGTGAHKLNFHLDITDQDGNYITNLVNDSAVAVPFFDPKAQDDNNDSTYGTFNTTMVLPKISLSANERLNFTINWVNSTTEWMALELDMKIDDENMAPYPSFLQIPQPDTTLPGYYTFDNDDEIKVLVTNSGTTGAWFTYQGSRVTFDDLSTTTSYAGIIKRLNSTIIDVNNDSILVPPGYTAEVNFTQPKSTPTSSTGTANLIPQGTYKMYVYLKGYDETGQLFLRTKNVGSVKVID